jgi:cell division protein FtsQ
MNPETTARARRLVTDRRIRERRRQVAASRVRRRRLQVLGALLAVGLAAGLVRLARSPLFGLTSIQVEGVAALSRDQVIAASGVRLGEPYLAIDLGAVERRLESLPRVAQATAVRAYPSGLKLIIRERQPTAALPAGRGRGSPGYWLVAADGTVLAQVLRRPVGLPDVRDVPLPPGIHPGTRLPPGNPLANALTALDHLTPALRQQVAAVTARSIDSLELQLRDGTRVLYGLADLQAAKDAAVLLLQQQLRARGQRAAQLDVRNPATPTVIVQTVPANAKTPTKPTAASQQGSAR